MEDILLNARQLMRNAEHCITAAQTAADESQRRRFLRAAKTWQQLAWNKQQAENALIGDDPERSLPQLSAA